MSLSPCFSRWLVSVGKTERALKSISVAARSNGLPIPTHIPTEDSAKTEAVTNTGILGLMSHRTLFIRLIIMSLEWIGTSTSIKTKFREFLAPF